MFKKIMILNFIEVEMVVFEELCEKKDLSKIVLFRQVLWFYQCVEECFEKGDKFFFEDEVLKEKVEIMML